MADVGARAYSEKESEVVVSERGSYVVRSTHFYQGSGAAGPTIIGIQAPSVRQWIWHVSVARSTFGHRWTPHFEAEARLRISRLHGTEMGRSGQGGNYDFTKRDVAVGAEGVFILGLFSL